MEWFWKVGFALAMLDGQHGANGETFPPLDALTYKRKWIERVTKFVTTVLIL